MRWIAWLMFAAACGSTATRPARPDHAIAGARAGTPAAAIDDRECDALIAHAVALGVSEQPAEKRATDAERDAVRASIAADFGRECRTLARERYQCAIAAPTLAELEGCQATPSSSTSNSSVAPGGMTAPAPRSP